MLTAAGIFAIFISIGFYLAVSADSSARYYWVRILDEGAINYLEQSRNSSSFNGLITNIIYNKVTYSVFSFAANYLKHLSVQFLALFGVQTTNSPCRAWD
jgi:glucose-6-phosphate-specific signal transduction histidine kinase